MAYKVKTASITEFKKSRGIWYRLASEMPLPSIFCHGNGYISGESILAITTTSLFHPYLKRQISKESRAACFTVRRLEPRLANGLNINLMR